MITWQLRPVLLLTTLLLATDAAAQQQEVVSANALVQAALARTQHQVRYDGRYLRIDYPWGDVPADIGVCTDVVIRSYRAVGVDLQQLVHADMRQHFALYPSQRLWGLRQPDPNIDHRRVPNLQTFFTRHGEAFAPSQDYRVYQPGDIVTWLLPGNRPHMGIVIDRYDVISRVPLIVHNIGLGPEVENLLFMYEISGHYRYLPALQQLQQVPRPKP